MASSENPTAIVDRNGLEVLSPAECWDHLAQAPIGRLAFIAAGGPLILPVVHAVVGRRVAFRSAPGSKLLAARLNGPVAFEVDAWDADERTGWSVVVRGVAMSAPDDADALDRTGLHPWVAAAGRGTWIEVRVDEISGRRLAPTGR